MSFIFFIDERIECGSIEFVNRSLYCSDSNSSERVSEGLNNLKFKKDQKEINDFKSFSIHSK